MKKPFTYTAATLLALSIVSSAMARAPQENMNQGKAAEEANAQRGQQMQVQQTQQREAQMQQQERQQAEARQNQEQAMKAQEAQARQSQMNAIKMQQTEAKQAQEQMRQQAQMQKEQQQQRNQATQLQKEQQEHNQAAEMQKEQQDHNKAAAVQGEHDRVGNAQPNHQNMPAHMNERMPGNERPPEAAAQQAEQRGEHQQHGGAQIAAQGQHMNPGASFVRATKPRAITANVVPTAKAVSMPVLEPGATAQEQQHAAAATKNLQAHLIAVPGNQAPQNFSGLRNTTVNNYFNNFRTTVNNRQVSINRQNTNFYNVPQTQFPHWWQPATGWTYSNGFTLGSLPCGADWLGWGWHPYWGPPPEGFVCESDYVPTPWFYFPAAGLWRQPGVMGYADYGPPYDYDGPITVEVMEPRHVQVRDPFTGWMNDRVVNVVYFYNAYYYPEFERYGYMNRHGYFIWLNLDDPDNY